MNPRSCALATVADFFSNFGDPNIQKIQRGIYKKEFGMLDLDCGITLYEE